MCDMMCDMYDMMCDMYDMMCANRWLHKSHVHQQISSVTTQNRNFFLLFQL